MSDELQKTLGAILVGLIGWLGGELFSSDPTRAEVIGADSIVVAHHPSDMLRVPYFENTDTLLRAGAYLIRFEPDSVFITHNPVADTINLKVLVEEQ